MTNRAVRRRSGRGSDRRAEAGAHTVGAIIDPFPSYKAHRATRMASHDYLKKTLTARVYDVARETELERAP
ncbi:MAG: PLP-dependent threonine dehydratase, partial [Paraburkholderia terricola]